MKKYKIIPNYIGGIVMGLIIAAFSFSLDFLGNLITGGEYKIEPMSSGTVILIILLISVISGSIEEIKSK